MSDTETLDAFRYLSVNRYESMTQMNFSTVPTQAKSDDEQSSGMVLRETIESFAVALILAFLFRAFVAEAFVIPTGSMAPTLMGAHKDITSDESGFGFQCGASCEYETETGKTTSDVVVGATCPVSRFEQAMDLKNRPNHQTFSGDRILVSKFSYLFSDPKRWDVIVFKFPENARQNYIKRCVGLPDETLRIHHGDIYIKSKEETAFEIARKPPNVAQAMLQPVADSKYLSKTAVAAGVPSAWQPSPEIGKGNPGWNASVSNTTDVYSNTWTVNQSPSSWSAKCEESTSKESTAWIRYYHRVLSPQQWDYIRVNGKPPAPIHPYSSRLISDFTFYNAGIYASRSDVYDQNRNLRPDYKTDWLPSDVRDNAGATYLRSTRTMRMANLETDGKHWTGDLATEFDIELGQGKGSVSLDIVEAGVHYQCSIDLDSGNAKIFALSDGKVLETIEAGNDKLVSEANAKTGLRSGQHHRLKFANVDNTLTLWVDGATVDFLPSNRIVTDSPATLLARRPQCNANDPLDAAPIGLGIQGVSAKVNRARVWRDIYYIAESSGFRNEDALFDHDIELTIKNNAEIVDTYRETTYGEIKDKILKTHALERDIVFSTPSLWDQSPFFANRNSVEFTLADDQFFPMGDNSPASSDARAWTNHYIPRRLLIGRAVVVFWPHFWMEPIPFIPNIARMGLIR